MDADALRALGWGPHFDCQLSAADRAAFEVLRVCTVQRTNLQGLGRQGAATVHFPRAGRWSRQVTVGDWILADARSGQHYLERVLERRNGLLRRAAGDRRAGQWIAANLDVAFVVMSCDEGFNANRLERFLAVALAGGVAPVVVLTKADLSPDPQACCAGVAADYPCHALDARDAQQIEVLRDYARAGHTLAFIGPSGAGKSTLVNTLAAEPLMPTAPARSDGKGRHTTTHRQLLVLPSGAMIIDTPGMRELGLAALERGLDALFHDVERLAERCRFRDCGHDGEPGCAVQAAVTEGRLEHRRWRNYLKMRREHTAGEAIHLRAEPERLGRRARETAQARPRRYDAPFDD